MKEGGKLKGAGRGRRWAIYQGEDLLHSLHGVLLNLQADGFILGHAHICGGDTGRATCPK